MAIDEPSGSTGLSRRDWVGLAATAALAGAWPLRAWSQSTRATFIRTATADVPPDAVRGATLVHEHLGSGRVPPSGQVVRPMHDPEWMARELQAAHTDGVGCIVSANSSLDGGDLAYLRSMSERSGLHIVPAGGYFMERNYPPDFDAASAEEIADTLVEAVERARLGLFGELGVGNDQAEISPRELKYFRSIGIASRRTGVPVLMHSNYATGPHVPFDMSLKQLAVFESIGVDPRKVALGHVCCLHDPEATLTQEACRRGAYVAFDRVTRQQQWVTDEQRLQTVLALLEAGFEDRILLSSDYIGAWAAGEEQFYPGSLHAREGGPGYARVLSLFVPQMRNAGVPEETILRLTRDNPLRFLALDVGSV